MDQFGNAMATKPAIAWSASGGSISTAGTVHRSWHCRHRYDHRQERLRDRQRNGQRNCRGNFLRPAKRHMASSPKSLDADGSISRNDMLQILDAVAANGAVTASELAI